MNFLSARSSVKASSQHPRHATEPKSGLKLDLLSAKNQLNSLPPEGATQTNSPFSQFVRDNLPLAMPSRNNEVSPRLSSVEVANEKPPSPGE